MYADNKTNKMSDTPTPRTDAVVIYHGDDDECENAINVSRQLERELAEAINDAEAWKREAQISEARLRGEKHQDDNGIVSPSEIVTKLHIELAEVTEQRDDNRLLYETEKKDMAFLQKTLKNVIAERDEASKQRDALADALSPFVTLNPLSKRVQERWHGYVLNAKQALAATKGGGL